MKAPGNDYVKLRLGTQESRQPKYLIALRATADYYGWSEEFEPWFPKTEETLAGRQFVRDPGRRGGLQFAGGRRHRICRSPVTAGYPKGLTNQFRVSSRVCMLDLAELAHFTKGEWHWMSSPFGERISRERWEAMWQAGTSRAEGGLVSA